VQKWIVSAARFFAYAFALLTASAALAQDSSQAGVSAAWQVQQAMTSLAEQVKRLEPVLAEAKPDRWVANGAAQSYVGQLQSAQTNVAALIAATNRLAKQPERMTATLDAYFRMEGVEAMLGSIRDGVRKYQNPELADRLTRLMAETSNNRDKLRAHIQDLAATREQEFQVMDQEAQRCRGMLVSQPAATANRNRKSK
jgi:hypothetical protein